MPIPSPRALRALTAALLGCLTLLAPSAHALEITAGDYEQLPAGTQVGLLYLQQASGTDLYAHGEQVVSGFKVRSQVAIWRYIRTLQVTANTTFDANLILPMAQVKGDGLAASLGQTHGVGDLVVGGAFKTLLDPVSRDVLAIAPFLTLPTGSHDPARPLNVGENRWKLLVQGVYVRHFNAQWALDTAADLTWFARQNRFGPAHATQSTALRTEVQGHLRHNLSPATTVSVGVGHIQGAENTVDGVRQGDALGSTYGRLTLGHFIDQTTQLQAQWGRDLSVRTGVQTSQQLNLRLMKLF
ncbi:transporter [Aquabacterium sp.]|uniref:transporter n=1 Tax=Aquabacterium sp. TaxID=1872578 RepID=UPI0025BA0084|nr:transporter [Aquabacterium sp.]